MSRLLAGVLAVAGCGGCALAAEKVVIRVGHFPNVTHAQALVARGLARQGTGWFEQRLGAGVEVRWFAYNAGPSAMEAIFTGALDLAYVGPNPALNAHLRSQGAEVRVIAGACSGGAALVVRDGGPIRSDADFRGRRVATPQFGNTQDVAARAWLRSKGYRVTITGGDVHVVPTSNPEQLALFKQGTVDAVWAVEPWVTRLVGEAGGRVYLEEREVWPQTQGRYVTTLLVSRATFLEQQPELVKRWIAAHVEFTGWMRGHGEEARRMLLGEFEAETKRALPAAVVEGAWQRLEWTHDPVRASLLQCAANAQALGFIRMPLELSRLYDLRLLNAVLREASLPEIP